MLEFILDVLEGGGKLNDFTASSSTFLFFLGGSREVRGNKVFRIADGGIRADQFFGKESLLLGALDPKENLGMADCESTLDEVDPDFLVEFHEAHGVGNGSPALSDTLGDLFLSEAEFLGESLIGGGLLDRIESLALEVLDQGQFKDLLIGSFTNDDRSLGKADLQRGAHAPFACDQLVLAAH